MKKRILAGITVGIQLIAIFIILVNYLLFTNTLANNRNWQITKNQLFKPGEDGNDFEKKLPALAQNALNLSAWRGWHEVILKEPIAWKKLSLHYLPGKNSYLYVIFHKSDKDFSAIRISYSPLYRSALISAKYTGEFTEDIPISIPQLEGSNWQELTLKKSESSSQIVEVFYNEELIATYNTATSTDGNIAFRAGKEEILIDDIQLENNDNQIVFNENFNGLNHFWLNLLISVIVLVLIDILFYLILKHKTNLFKLIVQLNFAIFIVLFIINLILFIFNSQLRSRYPSTDTISDIEEAIWQKKADEELLASYPIKDVNQTRIMVVGSSQTAGEGTSLEGEDFVSQFERLLNQNFSNFHQKFEVINLGREGQTSQTLFTHFQNQWLELKPDVVIVNLSSNDEEYEDGTNFENALKNFIKMSKKHHFKLIFVAEAVSIEHRDNLKTHQTMQEIAEKNQITFIDMHNELINHQDEGIIWWDFVHPTSFGYKLIANHLYESLKEDLGR